MFIIFVTSEKDNLDAQKERQERYTSHRKEGRIILQKGTQAVLVMKATIIIIKDDILVMENRLEQFRERQKVHTLIWSMSIWTVAELGK